MTFYVLLVPDIIFAKVEKALDTRARQLLKDLLDDAAERIFNTHLKVLLWRWCTSAVLALLCDFLPCFSLVNL